MSAQEQLKHLAPSARPNPAGDLGNNAARVPHEIKIGKTITTRKADGSAVLAELFTMTIGTETIELLPLKNWTQLDIFKWRARGVLPGTPAGLEVNWNQVKVAGATVSTWDSDSCARLENAFNDWLALERHSLETSADQAKVPLEQISSPRPFEEDEAHFELDLNHAD